MSPSEEAFLRALEAEEAAPEPNQSISEEAILRALAAQEAPQVGGGETLHNNWVNMLPAGGRLRDVLQALADRDIGVRARLTPEARAELERLGPIETPYLPAGPIPPTADEPMSILDTYRLVRDERAARIAAGSEQNPIAARAGMAAGIATSIAAPLPAVSIGARAAATGANAGRGLSGAARLAALARGPAASRLASASATGAAYGALEGATEGEADLTRGDVRGVLEDAVRGAGPGAMYGAVGGVVAEGARQGIPWLRRLAVRNTKEAIQGQSDIGAATRKPMRDESAAQMLDDNQLRAFDNVEDIHNRIVPQADKEGERLGEIISELEARGFKGADAQRVAQQLVREHNALVPNLSKDKSPAEIFLEEATNLKTVRKLGPDGQLGVRQTERIKEDLQSLGGFDRINPKSRQESYKKASRLIRLGNESSLLEQAVARDSKSREVAERFGLPQPEAGRGMYQDMVYDFLNQKKRLGKYLDAAQFSTRARAKFDQRPRVGLQDTLVGAAAGGDNIIKQKFWAKVNSELRSRSASTTAAGAEGLRKSLASGRAAERLGVGGASFGPFAADEAERWAESQDLDDPNLNPRVRALLEMLRRRKEQ